MFTWVGIAAPHPSAACRTFRVRAAIRMIFAWILEFHCQLLDPQLLVVDTSSYTSAYRQAESSSSWCSSI